MAKRTPFFESTSAALEQITRLYDFVWPTAAALWTLRQQVAEFHAARNGTATDVELRARFIEGSRIHGANLRRACLEHSWEYQTGALACFTLVNLFAIHESWTAALVSELGGSRTYRKGLQHPTDQVKQTGIRPTIAKLRGSESKALKEEVQPLLRNQADLLTAKLEPMMIVYRYFKECRNSIMHHGSTAGDRTVDAWNKLSKLDPDEVGFKIPKHQEIGLDKQVVVDLHGVVGFGDLVQKIVLTIDAELASSERAEQILIERWKKAYHGKVSLSSDETKRQKDVVRYLSKLRIAAKVGPELEQVLKRAGAVG